MIPLVRQPVLLAPLLIGASSIATLLLYFYGLAEMSAAVELLLLPAVGLLLLLLAWARQRKDAELWNRIVAGLFAGSLATLAYDIVRVPIAWWGIPVFKAISYFGTVILGRSSPTLASEMTGWAYHFSNGVGFGLMYVVIADRAKWWTAVLWGVTLEAAMLLTPYAEVFGYKVSPQFLTITIGAHVVYGLTLWFGLRLWCRDEPLGSPPAWQPAALFALWLIAPVGVSIAAADFSARYREVLAASPPTYVGRHLYVTWDVPEPDRIAALWLMRRFVDRDARFHFVPPFTKVSYGTQFDIPEAETRREAVRSVTEVLVEKEGLGKDERLRRLATMTHLTEVALWQLPSDREAAALAEQLRGVTATACGDKLTEHCVERVLAWFDRWYEGPS